jgi:hypothetical protein
MFFQMVFSFIKCAQYLFKIGKYFNINDWKLAKKIEIDEMCFSNTFDSNLLLALKIMDSKNVTLTKLFIFMW